MPIMVIMQGHSGSGKSTLAKHFAALLGLDTIILSTDDFFMSNGEYNFNPTLLGKAHKLTQCKCITYAEKGVNIVIDNTNTRNWEAAPYVKTGLKHGYTIQFVRATGNFPNVHGVPDSVIQAMKDRMEDLSIEECLKC